MCVIRVRHIGVQGRISQVGVGGGGDFVSFKKTFCLARSSDIAYHHLRLRQDASTKEGMKILGYFSKEIF